MQVELAHHQAIVMLLKVLSPQDQTARQAMTVNATHRLDFEMHQMLELVQQVQKVCILRKPQPYFYESLHHIYQTSLTRAGRYPGLFSMQNLRSQLQARQDAYSLWFAIHFYRAGRLLQPYLDQPQMHSKAPSHQLLPYWYWLQIV